MIERRLVLYPGSPREKTIIVNEPTLTIGRGGDCDLRLAESTVSERHATIICTANKTTLIDLDSRNGTRVNEARVSNTELKDGDRLTVGGVPINYCESQLQAQGETRSAIHFESLYRILENTISERSRPLLLECIIREMQDLLKLEHCGIYLCEDDRFYLMTGEQLQSQQKTKAMSETVLRGVLESGEPAFLEIAESDEGILGFESLMRLNISSLLCLPILDSEKEVYGALYCVSKDAGHLKILDRDRLFLEACSRILALALSNFAQSRALEQMAQARERTKQESRIFPVLKQIQKELSAAASEPNTGHWKGSGAHTHENFITQAAQCDLPVLLLGETGVGKSLWARNLHDRSRPGRPFVVVDCTAIPAALMESELFGHEKGAFTGAVDRHAGKLEAAADGSLFLDEIGDLPLPLQAKLLRLVQTNEYELVGSTKTRTCAARLVFATNHDLEKRVGDGAFRADLYYRLRVLQQRIPSLREAKDDIIPLARFLLNKHKVRINPRVNDFSQPALQTLGKHTWPGNIRELENAVLRALFNAQSEMIEPEDLQLENPIGLDAAPSFDAGNGLDLKAARENVDRSVIRRALQQSDGNVSRAARLLNLSRFGLIKMIKKLGISA